MTFQRRLYFLSLIVLLALALFSARILYWQMIRGLQMQAVALDPLSAAAAYAQQEQQNGPPVPTGNGSFQNLENLPQPVLQRTIALLKTITRGSMYDRTGQILVSDQVDNAGNFYRSYADPSLVFITGYTSALRTGLTGLERTYNDTLLGVNRIDAQLNMGLHEPVKGSDLILTVDENLQQQAAAALGGIPGAVVILDGHSGAVLAMASFPRFDPNHILDEGYAGGLIDNCNGAFTCTAPFIDRGTQALYIPGSIFKTVTLIAGLDTGQVTPETIFDFGQEVQGPDGPYFVYPVGGGEVIDPNHPGKNRLNLVMSYAASANAAFAKVADQMSPDIFIQYAEKLGFSQPANQQWPIEIEYSPAQLANHVDDLRTNDLLRASTGYGQGEILTSPLNMAMVYLSVLNNGDLPIPYFVQAIRNPDGSTNERLPNRHIARGLYKAQTAQQVKSMMITAVKEGSGYLAAVPGIIVGGKTGTAQLGGNAAAHAWFVGFADNGKQSVVMAVILENHGHGSLAAAPIFAKLVPAALQAASSAPVAEDAAGQQASAQLNAATSTPAQPTLTAQPAQPTQLPDPTQTATQPSQPAGPLPIVTLNSLLAPDIPRDPSKPQFYADQPSCPMGPNPPVGSGKFIWPSQYQALSGADYTATHPGLDLNAPMDSPVFAADSGVVVFAGVTGVGYGNVVLIDHRNGYQTLYGHLDQISVRCGQSVTQGKIIGLSGSTGNSSGPHLHFEVRVPGGFINPLKVLPTP